jgi:hypothetical protein
MSVEKPGSGDGLLLRTLRSRAGDQLLAGDLVQLFIEPLFAVVRLQLAGGLVELLI